MAKLTHQLSTDHYLSGALRLQQQQPGPTVPARPRRRRTGASARTRSTPSNVNLNSVLGDGKHQRVHVPVLVLPRTTSARTRRCPPRPYPNGVTVGQSVNTPQTTEQHKYQFRDDFTWQQGRPRVQGGRQLHQRARRSDITFSTGQQPLYVHLADSRTSAISNISYNGSIGSAGGGNVGSIPNKQYAFYLQDGWRVYRQADARPRRPLRPTSPASRSTRGNHHLPRGHRGRPARRVHLGRACPAPAPASRTSASRRRRTRTTSRPAPGSPTTSKGDGGSRPPRRRGPLLRLRLHQRATS